MMKFGLNKWQRLVVAAASMACLARAWFIFHQDYAASRPGTAFITGIFLAVVALARPRHDEPSWPLIQQHPKGVPRVAFWVVALGLALALAAFLQISAIRQNEERVATTADEAATDAAMTATDAALAVTAGATPETLEAEPQASDHYALSKATVDQAGDVPPIEQPSSEN